ncbi:MAG TPA: T9SS type A sorting domain-containing protein, partial [Chitinophagaceae bacterium]|nr:T9SS type A sorting domain-containing protein [Chitinophagaceae bacterium]
YPNPVRGEFISLQSSDLTKGNYSVRVMNSAGQQVYTQRFNHTGGAINQTIHLPVGMQSGIYILQLDRETSKVLSKTFVVQK